MRTIISGGIILTPDQTLRDHHLVIEDHKIKSLVAGSVSAQGKDERLIDAHDLWVIPGLIDIHVHGSYGHDTMDATPEALHAMARFFASHGVTSFLPTTVSTASEDITAAIDNISTTEQPSDGAQILGVHLEGPYLNMEFKGAQPPEHIRSPDPKEYLSWLANGEVRLITLAPEIEGALSLIDHGVSQGIQFAVGHSGASYEEMVTATDQGLRQATHTFNGMLGLHHRQPGTAGAVLADDRIYAQVIADGVHLHPAIVKLLVRCKTPSRTILITDAMRATGLADGEYDLGGHVITVKDGVARTETGSLAGSTLSMDMALRNMIRFTGLSLSEAIPMATSVPAEAMGIKGQKGVLAPDADADVVILDTNLNVWLTMIAGQVVYTSNDTERINTP